MKKSMTIGVIAVIATILVTNAVDFSAEAIKPETSPAESTNSKIVDLKPVAGTTIFLDSNRDATHVLYYVAFGERWPTEPEALFDLMRTHGPGGLCQHGDEDLYTVLSGVLRLRARRLSVAFGAPCAQEYIDYNLEDDHAV